MSGELVPAASTLEDLPLGQLGEIANEQHRACVHAGTSMLEHAIRAGRALIEIRDRLEPGRWSGWLREAFEGSDQTARAYVRVATYAHHLPADPTLTLHDARRLLIGLPHVREKTGGVRIPIETAALVKALAAGGESGVAIADRLGISRTSVSRILAGPARRKKEREQQRRYRQRQQKATRALQRAERERALRQLGDYTGEAYSLIRKAAQVLDRAQVEAVSRDHRAALTAALQRVHAAEDALLRAIGCQSSDS